MFTLLGCNSILSQITRFGFKIFQSHQMTVEMKMSELFHFGAEIADISWLIVFTRWSDQDSLVGWNSFPNKFSIIQTSELMNVW